MTLTRSDGQPPAPKLAAIHRHVGEAHQQFTTAAEVNDDVAAACLEDLDAALELLEEADPSLRAKANAE